eukprot:TRINITY_DN66407_c8_g6_i1.p1 TRINITY_DN66407_c8_g6~~TRINITY_DN66407_c8_g6_i1.p1  ORF type:complete len:244 (-),score=11.86 TRINITY_DN66407_c8_g6_i1:136-867(-)
MLGRMFKSGRHPRGIRVVENFVRRSVAKEIHSFFSVIEQEAPKRPADEEEYFAPFMVHWEDRTFLTEYFPQYTDNAGHSVAHLHGNDNLPSFTEHAIISMNMIPEVQAVLELKEYDSVADCHWNLTINKYNTADGVLQHELTPHGEGLITVVAINRPVTLLLTRDDGLLDHALIEQVEQEDQQFRIELQKDSLFLMCGQARWQWNCSLLLPEPPRQDEEPTPEVRSEGELGESQCYTVVLSTQ